MLRKSVTRGRSRRGAAFTLVELLVVVSIIALLIAILLPSLKKARQAAKRVACNANVRSIAQAGLTYASDDRQELSIPIGPGDGDVSKTDSYTSYVGFGGKSGLGPDKNANTSVFGGSPLYRMGAPHRPLNMIMFKGEVGGPTKGSGGRGGSGAEDWTQDSQLNLEVYHCPGDSGSFPGMHQKGWKDAAISGYDYFGTSYAANPLYVGFGTGSKLSSNAIYARPMSRVPSPSDTVMYWEYAARYAPFAKNSEEYNQSGCQWGTLPFWVYTAYGHHDQPYHFNVAFGDGHSTWVKIKGSGLLDDSRIASVNRCIVVRGLGWRVDTLPAEPVETHKIWGGSGVSTRDGDSGNSMWDIVEK